ncbi:MAG: DUF2726 domain-containing protein [Burkholderiales bacterium]|nr:DUF2726 domain-containing protein [Burkholderiales bacterium]
MTSVAVAIILLVALLLVWWGVRKRASHQANAGSSDGLDTVTGWPPQATRVLTTPERQAYDLLRNALPAHVILAQVPLQRFIKVPTRNSYAEWLRRVGQLSADFVICDRHSQVIAIVELRTGDEQPSSRARRRHDRLLKVLAAAQIPVHQWSSESLPSVEAAREAIAPSVAPAEGPMVGTSSGVLRSAPGRPAATKPHLASQETSEDFENDAPPVREPPPSTWFDDLDTGPAPLDPEPPKNIVRHKDRPAR